MSEGFEGLPWAEEAEKCVIGSMLVGGPTIVEEVKAKLPYDAFYSPRHAKICFYIFSSIDAGLPIDLTIFTQTLRDHGVLEEVGGHGYVTELFAFMMAPSLVDYYMDIVREKWILRGIIQNCTDTCRRCYTEQNDVDVLLAEHMQKALEIGELNTKKEALLHISDFVPGAVQEIEAVYRSRGSTVGLPSGFVDLDRMTGGFQAPMTYYFAARPSMGKSSVMIDVAEYIAITNAAQGNNVGIFSIEMTGRQMVKRLICRTGEINLQRVRDGFFAKTEDKSEPDKPTLERVKWAGDQVAKGNIWIDETSHLSIFEFRARARRAVMKMKCKILIIDYIQKMCSTSKRAQGNREQEMNEVAQGISQTAKDLNIPIIVLAQLNRKNEDRADKVPALADLRESGSIEQEARFVGLLHRPSYYVHGAIQTANQDEAPEKRSQARLKKLRAAAIQAGLRVPDVEMDGTIDENWRDPEDEGGENWVERFEQHAEVIVAKQNEGPTGIVRLRFRKEFAKFENVTKSLYSNNPDNRQQSADDDW